MVEPEPGSLPIIVIVPVMPHQYGPDVEKRQTAKTSGSETETFGSKTSEVTRATHRTTGEAEILGVFRGTNQRAS